MGDYLIFS